MPLIRQKYTKLDRASDQRVAHESKKWYCLYKRGGKWLRVPAYTDKAASLQKLARLEREADREAEGMDVYGHAARPILGHAADFRQHVADRGNTPNHVNTTDQRLKYVLSAGKIKTILDLTPARVDRALAELVARDGKSAGRSLSSRNHYLRATKMFSRWLVAEHRLASDPLAGMGYKNTDQDRRRIRRPLTQDEFPWLICAAIDGPDMQDVSGLERALLYLIGSYTGYRRNELGSIMARSFEFGEAPILEVAAGSSKRRRADKIPLHVGFSDLLQHYLEDVAGEPGQLLFDVSDKRTAEMVRADLAAARAMWLNESESYADRRKREASDFLAAAGSDGRVVDFHALRGTFITRLSESGVMPKMAQILARHSSIDLTMQTYTHLAESDQQAAMGMLPWLDPETEAALEAAIAAGRPAPKILHTRLHKKHSRQLATIRTRTQAFALQMDRPP